MPLIRRIFIFIEYTLKYYEHMKPNTYKTSMGNVCECELIKSYQNGCVEFSMPREAAGTSHSCQCSRGSVIKNSIADFWNDTNWNRSPESLGPEELTLTWDVLMKHNLFLSTDFEEDFITMEHVSMMMKTITWFMHEIFAESCHFNN